MEQRITAPKGCKIESVEHDDNSVVIMFSEDKPNFKRGDFLILKSSKQIVIYKSTEDKYNITFSSYYNNNDGISNNNWVVVSFRLCNDREKQEMLDYMHSHGVDWDDVNMKVSPYIWKPKAGEKYWCISNNLKVCFSFYNPEDKLCIKDIRDNNCFKTEELTLKYAEEFKRILKERKL